MKFTLPLEVQRQLHELRRVIRRDHLRRRHALDHLPRLGLGLGIPDCLLRGNGGFVGLEGGEVLGGEVWPELLLLLLDHLKIILIYRLTHYRIGLYEREQFSTDFDDFGVVAKPRISALQRYQNHQNPWGIDLLELCYVG